MDLTSRFSRDDAASVGQATGADRDAFEARVVPGEPEPRPTEALDFVGLRRNAVVGELGEGKRVRRGREICAVLRVDGEPVLGEDAIGHDRLKD